MVKKFNKSIDTNYENLESLMHNFATISELCNDMVNAFYYDNFEEFSIEDMKDTVDFIKSKVNNIESVINKM